MIFLQFLYLGNPANNKKYGTFCGFSRCKMLKMDIFFLAKNWNSDYYVCLCACIYECMNADMNVSLHECICVWMHVHLCIVRIHCKQNFVFLSISVCKYFFYQLFSLYFSVFMFPFFRQFSNIFVPRILGLLKRPKVFQAFLFDFSKALLQKPWRNA